MAIIGARSPYIISINETNQIETKIEIFIINGEATLPTSPTYTLSKIVPSASNRRTDYNISPYIKEFLAHPIFQNNHTSAVSLNTDEWCTIGIKKYKKLTTTWIQVGSTEFHKGFDGYGLYTEGYNKDLGRFLLKPKTYYYLYDPFANLTTQPLKRAGSITVYGAESEGIRYSQIGTANTQFLSLSVATWTQVPRVHTSYMATGCKTQYIDYNGAVLWEGIFKPKTECKYTPICCDFINRYGAWQREYFFKASRNNISIENSEYNLYQEFVNYDTKEGQRKTFNTNYSETITVNTDWVEEDFSDNLRELMTSERILLDNLPVKLNTKSVELQKHINTKMINYTLEFQYAFDVINNVV
jgi:hypothetical protein